MAQDFERSYSSSISNASGSPTTLVTSNSDDALISIRCANKYTTAVNVTVLISSGGTDFYVIKDAPIPTGGSLELIDGGSKVVLQTGDAVKAYASAATSVDIITSVVDTISA